jgi:hypothetical protein
MGFKNNRGWRTRTPALPASAIPLFLTFYFICIFLRNVLLHISLGKAAPDAVAISAIPVLSGGHSTGGVYRRDEADTATGWRNSDESIRIPNQNRAD